MRTTVGVLLGAVMMFVGIIALSENSQQVEDTALNNSNASADALNVTNDVIGGVGQAGGQAIVWMGIGAIIVGALGVLVYAGRSGR